MILFILRNIVSGACISVGSKIADAIFDLFKKEKKENNKN